MIDYASIYKIQLKDNHHFNKTEKHLMNEEKTEMLIHETYFQTNSWYEE